MLPSGENTLAPAPAPRQGSKGLGICMILLVGGTTAMASGGPDYIPGLGVLLALLILVLGIYSLFRVTLLSVGLAFLLLLCGIAFAVRNLWVSCFGACAFVYSPATIIVCVIFPALIGCAMGYRARTHRTDDSSPMGAGGSAVYSLLLGLIASLPVVLCASFNIDDPRFLVALVVTLTGFVAGLSLAIDAVRSPRRILSIAGVVLNSIGLTLAGLMLPMAVARHPYYRGVHW